MVQRKTPASMPSLRVHEDLPSWGVSFIHATICESCPDQAHRAVFASILSKPGVSHGGHGILRFTLFHHWVRFERICDGNSRFRTAHDTPLIEAAVGDALLCHNALYSEGIFNNQLLWQVLPKAHMAEHLGFDFSQTVVDSRRVTNYSDEDMVGTIKRIMSSCHGGSAGKMAMFRYVILVGTRWWDRLTYLRGLR